MTRVQRWSAFTALAVVLVLAAGWFLAISPQKSHAASLRASVAAQNQTNATLSNTVQQLKAQQSDVTAEDAKVAAVAQKLPSTPALPAYIRQLVSAAAATGVDLDTIAPVAPAAVTVAAATAAPAVVSSPDASVVVAAPAPTTAPLQLITVQVTVYGGYFQVQQFISKVESFGRTTTISSIALAPGVEQGSTAGSVVSGLAPLPAAPTSTASALKAPSPAAVTTNGEASWTTLKADLTLNIFETSVGALGGPVASASPSAATN